MSHEESAELTEPDVRVFDDPSGLVAPELAPVFVAPVLAVLEIRNDEVDASFLEPFSQRIGVISEVGDHAFWLLSRTSFGTGDFDLGERGFRKRNFFRRGTFQPNSQRKTATFDQYHPLCPLAALGFTDRGAQLFRRGKAAVQDRCPTAA